MIFPEDRVIDELNARMPRHKGTLVAILYAKRNRFGEVRHYYVYKLNTRKNGLEGWIKADHITFDKQEKGVRA